MKYRMAIKNVAKRARYLLRNPGRLINPLRDVVCETKHGLSMYCSFENLIERQVMQSGVFEEPCTRLVNKYVQRGWTTFDIGANVGYYTLLLSQRVGRNGEVHSFEPTSYALARLRANLELNRDHLASSVVLNSTGLSDSTGESVEAIESRFSEAVAAYSEPELVRFRTLDEYCEEHSIDRLDFVKIDVDGYDHRVIRGGCGVLARFQPVILCELCDRALQSLGDSLPAYMRTLVGLGYDHCILAGGRDRVGSLRRLTEDGSLLLHDSSNALLFPYEFDEARQGS